jgi:hypothetical protein
MRYFMDVRNMCSGVFYLSELSEFSLSEPEDDRSDTSPRAMSSASNVTGTDSPFNSPSCPSGSCSHVPVSSRVVCSPTWLVGISAKDVTGVTEDSWELTAKVTSWSSGEDEGGGGFCANTELLRPSMTTALDCELSKFSPGICIIDSNALDWRFRMRGWSSVDVVE